MGSSYHWFKIKDEWFFIHKIKLAKYTTCLTSIMFVFPCNYEFTDLKYSLEGPDSSLAIGLSYIDAHKITTLSVTEGFENYYLVPFFYSDIKEYCVPQDIMIKINNIYSKINKKNNMKNTLLKKKDLLEKVLEYEKLDVNKRISKEHFDFLYNSYME